jgi:hypothetical protein
LIFRKLLSYGCHRLFSFSALFINKLLYPGIENPKLKT